MRSKSRVETGNCVKPVLGVCTQWWCSSSKLKKKNFIFHFFFLPKFLRALKMSFSKDSNHILQKKRKIKSKRARFPSLNLREITIYVLHEYKKIYQKDYKTNILIKKKKKKKNWKNKRINFIKIFRNKYAQKNLN